MTAPRIVSAYQASDGSLHLHEEDALAVNRREAIRAQIATFVREYGDYVMAADVPVIDAGSILDNIDELRDILNGRVD